MDDIKTPIGQTISMSQVIGFWRLNRIGNRLRNWLALMIIEFQGEIFYWRGPAPFLFISIPEEPSRNLKAISAMVTYGWGVIPVHAQIGNTRWKTSLIPREGRYLVPIRMSVQRSENLDVGDSVFIRIEIVIGK